MTRLAMLESRFLRAICPPNLHAGLASVFGGAEPVDVEVEIGPEVAQGLERLPQARMRLEMDFLMLPSPVQEDRRSRPYFPYMLMTVDAGSGMVLGHDMLYVETSVRTELEPCHPTPKRC